MTEHRKPYIDPGQEIAPGHLESTSYAAEGEIPPFVLPGSEAAPECATLTIERPGYEPAQVLVMRADSAKVIGENVLVTMRAMRQKRGPW